MVRGAHIEMDLSLSQQSNCQHCLYLQDIRTMSYDSRVPAMSSDVDSGGDEVRFEAEKFHRLLELSLLGNSGRYWTEKTNSFTDMPCIEHLVSSAVCL